MNNFLALDWSWYGRRLPCSVRWPARCVSIVSILLFHPFLVVKLQSRWGWQLICNFVDQFNWSWSSYRLALPPERIKDPHVVNWNVSMPTMEICSCWRMLCCDGKFVIKFYALNISSLAYIVEVKQKWKDWLSPYIMPVQWVKCQRDRSQVILEFLILITWLLQSSDQHQSQLTRD